MLWTVDICGSWLPNIEKVISKTNKKLFAASTDVILLFKKALQMIKREQAKTSFLEYLGNTELF